MLTLPSYKLACTWLSVAAHRSLKYAPIDELGGGGERGSVLVQGSCQPSSLGLCPVCVLSPASGSAVLQPLLMGSG